MKKLILLVLIFACISLRGQNVSLSEAIAVSTTFMNKVYDNRLFVVETVDSLYKDTDICLYKVLFTNGEWCLVPSTKTVSPILAFDTSDVGDNEAPEAYNNLIEQYLTEINAYIHESDNETRLVNGNWETLLNPSRSNDFTYTIGDSLLDMTGRDRNIWKQSCNNSGTDFPSYHMFCPESNANGCYCGHYHAGCGAVAMGQIMWYWQWPRESIYRTYHWEKMPAAMYYNTSQEEAEEVAHLLRDCGILTRMSYNCFGSFTVSDSIIKAFKNSFGYKGIVKRHAQDWEYGNSWRDLISSEIDNGRPVLFYGDEGLFFSGHFFVVDGYMNYGTERLFHANYGHGGEKNGFYKLDRFHEGTDYYNCNNRAIVGISPTYNESQISNLNYIQVPSGHKRKEYAYNSVDIPASGNTLTVESGAEYIVEAGDEIVLRDGFVAKYGSEVNLRINPAWQSHMSISVPYWPNVVNNNGYCINQKNADSWEFSLMNTNNHIVYQSAGSINSDYVCLWNGQGLSSGSYLGIITLKNSYGRSLHQEIAITVLNREQAIISDPSDNSDSNIIPTTEHFNNYSIDSNLRVQPNPSSGIFEISNLTDTIISLDVHNVMGQHLYTDDNIMSTKYTLNLSSFPNGNYIIFLRSRQKTYSTKIMKQ